MLVYQRVLYQFIPRFGYLAIPSWDRTKINEVQSLRGQIQMALPLLCHSLARWNGWRFSQIGEPKKRPQTNYKRKKWINKSPINSCLVEFSSLLIRWNGTNLEREREREIWWNDWCWRICFSIQIQIILVISARDWDAKPKGTKVWNFAPEKETKERERERESSKHVMFHQFCC